MRVAFDVTPLVVGGTGVARYCLGLADGLRGQDIDLLPFAIGRGRPPEIAGVRRSHLPLRAAHAGWGLLGRPTARRLVGVDFDLVHATDMIAPPTDRPVVITIHDLAALEMPELHSGRQVAIQRRQVANALNAAMVLAVSAATASSAIAFGVSRDRLAVTPLAVSGQLGSDVRVARAAGSAYLLVVGELHRRKNLPALIRAFANARLPDDVSLIIAGPPGSASAEVEELSGDRVRTLGRVSDEELKALYAGATALCFPSLAEGFGLPVLEAMASSVPVIASDIPVIREITGRHAVLVDPHDIDGWTSAIEGLVNDPDLRADLARRGLERASAFGWDRTAELTIEAYRRALA